VSQTGVQAPRALGYAQHTGSSPRPGKSSTRWLQPWAWPGQRSGMAAKRQVSAAPTDAPPAWHLGPAGCSLTHAPTKQCNP